MSTIDPSQLTAADLSNPALSAQDLADITAARPDLRPYVATHPSLYPALGQWLADQGVVPAQPPAAEEPAVSEPEAPAEETGEQAEPFAGGHEEAQPEADAAPTEAPVEQSAVEEPHVETPAEPEAAHVEPEAAHVEPEAPVSEAAEAHDDNLEQAILEGAAQSEAPAGDEAAPALSTEEQVAQSPFSNPPQVDAQPQGQPQFGAQPQQGQQAPFGQQPGQPQYGTAPQQAQQAQQGQQGQPQQAPFGQPGQPQFGAQPQQGQQPQQAPFGQPGQQGQPQFGAQPQQGQQAPFGQPGQPQYGQPGYAPASQSAGQQFGAAAQQFGAAANSAFNQFQTAVVAETGKVSGRSVRATYSLIGIAASAVLILISMMLPYFSNDYASASMFTVKGGYSAFHLILLMAVVGLGVAYWFTNQKWAYLSAGIGALVMALLGVIQFIVALSDQNEYARASFGAYMLALFSIAIGVAGGFLLMELKTGAVAPINNPNAFGGAFAGAQMGQQQGQFGQQQGGFQAPQGGQPQFGQQQGGFQAPQGGQPQFGQQQGGFQAPQAGQPQFGQQAQFGQQQGQQPQLGDKPYNPFGPQA